MKGGVEGEKEWSGREEKKKRERGKDRGGEDNFQTSSLQSHFSGLFFGSCPKVILPPDKNDTDSGNGLTIRKTTIIKREMGTCVCRVCTSGR